MRSKESSKMFRLMQSPSGFHSQRQNLQHRWTLMDPEAEDKTTTALHIGQQDVKTSTELISKAKNNKIVKFKN